MTTFAYLRVSTDRQDLDNQRHGILEYANSHRLGPLEFVEDAVSGRIGWHDLAVGDLLLQTASEGDVVSQTNGMVERFNGRIAEVLATRRFRSGEHLEDTLIRYVNTYNHHIPQRALGATSAL